jgi:hypothetical protein
MRWKSPSKLRSSKALIGRMPAQIDWNHAAANLPDTERVLPASSGQSTGEGVGHSKVRCTQLSDVQSMILFTGSIAAIDALALAWRTTLLVVRGR